MCMCELVSNRWGVLGMEIAHVIYDDGSANGSLGLMGVDSR
jgi:hypothetical protein